MLCILLGLTDQFVNVPQLFFCQAALCHLLAQMSGCSKTRVILLQPKSSCCTIVHVHSCPLFLHLPGTVLMSFAELMLLKEYQKRGSYKIITKEDGEGVQTPAAKHGQKQKAETSLKVIKERYVSCGRACVTYLCPFSNWAGFFSGVPLSRCLG